MVVKSIMMNNFGAELLSGDAPEGPKERKLRELFNLPKGEQRKN